MKVVVINGTAVKGCTHPITESFRTILRDGNEITEFSLPADCPHFCLGCKTCFSKTKDLCPHGEPVEPIGNAIREADWLMFACPVCVSDAP